MVKRDFSLKIMAPSPLISRIPQEFFNVWVIAEGIILHKDGVIINLNAFGKSEIPWFNDVGQSER